LNYFENLDIIKRIREIFAALYSFYKERILYGE